MCTNSYSWCPASCSCFLSGFHALRWAAKQAAVQERQAAGACASSLPSCPRSHPTTSHSQADVYSYSILLYELWAQQRPYEGEGWELAQLLSTSFSPTHARPALPGSCAGVPARPEPGGCRDPSKLGKKSMVCCCVATGGSIYVLLHVRALPAPTASALPPRPSCSARLACAHGALLGGGPPAAAQLQRGAAGAARHEQSAQGAAAAAASGRRRGRRRGSATGGGPPLTCSTPCTSLLQLLLLSIRTSGSL